MKTTGVNIKALWDTGASLSDCVDAVFVSTDFESLIEHAKSGDKAAAKEILALSSAYLTSEIFGPFPSELKGYLRRALAAASLGGSADVALNLKNKPSGGRTRQERRTKLRIGHLIYKAMKAGGTGDDQTRALRAHIKAKRAGGIGRAGATLDEASSACEAHIRAGIKKNGTFYGYSNAPSSKRLEAIYSEVLPEIEATYKEVLLELGSSSET
jgi:hypothetical protein